MNFLYFPIFCVFFLPARGYIAFAVMRSPGNTSDNLDLRIDGSIDIGDNWHYSDVRNVISKLGQSLTLDDRAVTKNNREALRNIEDSFHNRPRNKLVGNYGSNGFLQQHKGGKPDKQKDLKERVIIENVFSEIGDPSVTKKNRELPPSRLRNKNAGYHESSGFLQQQKGGKSDKRGDIKERIIMGTDISKTGQSLGLVDRVVTKNNREVQQNKKDWFHNRPRNIFGGDHESSGFLHQHKGGKPDKRGDIKERIIMGNDISKTGQSLGLGDRVVTKNNREVQQNKKDWFHNRPRNIFGGNHESSDFLHQHKGGKPDKQDDLKERIIIENGISEIGHRPVTKKNREVQEIVVDLSPTGLRNKNADYHESSGFLQQQRGGKSDRQDDLKERIIIGNGISEIGDRPVTKKNREVQEIVVDLSPTGLRNKNADYHESSGFLQQQRGGKSDRQDDLKERIIIGNGISEIGDRPVTKKNREVQEIVVDLSPTGLRNKNADYHESSGFLQQQRGGKSDRQDDLKERIIIENDITEIGDRPVTKKNREVQEIVVDLSPTRLRNKNAGYHESSGFLQQQRGGKSDKRGDIKERIIMGNDISKTGQSLGLGDRVVTKNNREVQQNKKDWFHNRPRNIFGGNHESSGFLHQHKGGKPDKQDDLKERIIIENDISEIGHRPVTKKNREVQEIIVDVSPTRLRNKNAGYHESSGFLQQHKGNKTDTHGDLTDKIIIGNVVSKSGQSLGLGVRAVTKNNREVQQNSENFFHNRPKNKFGGYHESSGLHQQHKGGKSDKQDDLKGRIIIENDISEIGDRPVTKKNREVQEIIVDLSPTHLRNKNAGYHESSGLLQQHKGGKLDKRGDLRERIVIEPMISSTNKDDKNIFQWDLDIRQSENDEKQWRTDELFGTTSKEVVLRRKRQKEGIAGVTQLERTKTTDHKVKEDERTNGFSVHMFKQTMQVFESIKRKMANYEMKAKVDEMARSYKDQFADFVRSQRDTSVRTKTGDQRAVLHTMDTSNLILQRLVNFLKADMDDTGLRSTSLQREVDAVRELEYKHVCSKYGYCRSDKGFTTMLQNCIKILINVDDDKMYRARDALTEVLKTGDYRQLIDSKTDKIFQKKLKHLETSEPGALRQLLSILLGILSNPETPLEVEGGNSKVVKKTAAFYTLLAMWEDAMPADESNKLEWADIEKSLGDWSSGKRSDIQEIIKALESNINRGFQKVDPEILVKMREQINIIRG